MSPGDPLPSGLTVDQLDIGDLLNSLVITGHRGRLAYAADLFSTQVEVAVANLVVVVTRESTQRGG